MYKVTQRFKVGSAENLQTYITLSVKDSLHTAKKVADYASSYAVDRKIRENLMSGDYVGIPELIYKDLVHLLQYTPAYVKVKSLIVLDLDENSSVSIKKVWRT